MEGCLVQGVSRALIEHVAFTRVRQTSLDWVTYPVIRFKDSPAVTTIVRPAARPAGRRLGRADDRGCGGRDRERVLRRDRRAAAARADEPRLRAERARRVADRLLRRVRAGAARTRERARLARHRGPGRAARARCRASRARRARSASGRPDRPPSVRPALAEDAAHENHHFNRPKGPCHARRPCATTSSAARAAPLARSS